MPQKLFIPNLGTILVLAEDWTFRLYFEDRNNTMLQVFGAKKQWWWNILRGLSRYPGGLNPDLFEEGKVPDNLHYEDAMTQEELATAYDSYKATNSHANPYLRVTLPTGTQLKIDRIYIRQGGESFASVTFRTTKVCPDKRFAGKRFWVKLQEANQIVADIVG